MLNFSLKSRTPVMLQTEAAECGLVCLAMVAGHHGHMMDLATLRSRHAISLRGSTLADLMGVAGMLKLTPRPLRLDLPHLNELKLPCILHWDFQHFVVLVGLKPGQVVIHDPASGVRLLALDEFSRHFTGVALEVLPSDEFVPRDERQRMSLWALMGRVPGLGGMLTQILGLALVLQLFAVLSPFFMQWVVDQALVSQDRDLVTVLGCGFLLMAVIQALVMGMRGWLLMVLGTSLNLHMSTRVFRHLIRLPMVWFERRHMGDIVSRFEALQVIQRTLTSGFVEALIDGVMALLTLAMMLLYAPTLAAVAVMAATAYAALRIAMHRPQQLATHEHIVCLARQHSHFLETVRGMQCIKLFSHEAPRTVAWHNLAVDQFNAGIRIQRVNVVYQAANSLLFGLENVITIWLGARMVLDSSSAGAFSVGMLFAFMSYKTQFVQRIAGLIEKAMELRMLGLHTERVADIVRTPVEPTQELAAGAMPAVKGRLDVRQLSFRYGDGEPLVLQGLSFSVEAGESVAIVGPSGCGKTTLLKILLGLMQPDDGLIEVDGVPLSHMGLSTWRRAVASVMQDDVLFAGSIGDNIAFFDTQPDHAWIEQCARMASIHADIVAMPMQYNTLVGDMGAMLSGGQRQRILLARALYRRPRILVLDEATSHLDVSRERSVNEAIKNLRLTRIIVAHRPETIASADKVLVLRDGMASLQEIRNEA
ncbi:MAG: peptidase domain-containing ABC transporter [Aquabacterium sp.]|uniref:peptidase domain-containing ABC transporter n=1 Tax=Aquabacterium sp. TaxID=1872578 RepID=UPI00121457FA|nr:peptidase domain-containing ABC transporter [Aquabacterium sp.]TAK99722.1 MAG: peptidase domain-containing ABC transporter [Aquabacterium sp.]